MNSVAVNKIGQNVELGLFNKKSATQSSDFMQVFSKAIEQTNNLQLMSDQYAEKLVTGQVENLHDVIIAGQKADISLQLLTAVRGKILDAYTEIMRMQV